MLLLLYPEMATLVFRRMASGFSNSVNMDDNLFHLPKLHVYMISLREILLFWNILAGIK